MTAPRARAAALAAAAALAGLAAVIACGAGAGWGGEPVTRPDRPNFVVILADDLGYGDLGVYGQDKIHTPRLDAMAASGLRLRHFYSGAPICPPARDTLLTGRHTGHTTIRRAGALPADSGAEPRYLPRFLDRAGYVSGVFGKWGMGAYTLGDEGPQVIAAAPEWLGFDAFLGMMVHRDAHTQTLPPYPVEPGDERIHPRLWTIRDGVTGQAPRRRVPYTQGAFFAAAADFVRANRDRPFFLYLPVTVPHAELYLPPDDPAWSRYLDAGGESVFPEIPFEGDRLYRRPNPRPRATYAAMITRFDREVGGLLDLFDELGIAGHTVVLVTSDNGPHQAGGIQGPEFFDSTGGLAGWKGNLFEGGIRVPAIVRWPGTVAPGRVVDVPLALWDVAPTFLDLAAVEAPGWMDGLSFAPLLRGEPQPRHDDARPLYWESFAGFRGQAVRVGRYKLLRRVLQSPDDHVILTDLVADPTESRNLASRPEHCPTYRRLARVLNASRTEPPGQFAFPPLREECPAAGQPNWPPPRRIAAPGG